MKYTVKKGDTLSGIAEAHYGHDGGWKDIFERNRSVLGKNPDLIYPGQVIDIPFDFVSFLKNFIKDVL